MTVIDYIYALYEKESNLKFYVGRTIDPHRRLGEHRSAGKNYQPGDEWVYEYIHTLGQAGLEWDMEILMECGPDTEFFEDYFINLYRDQPLQNMKAGDTEPWMGRDYAGPKEFVTEKYRCIEQERIRKIKRQNREKRSSVSDDVSRIIFAGQRPHERFVSKGFLELKRIQLANDIQRLRSEIAQLETSEAHQRFLKQKVAEWQEICRREEENDQSNEDNDG